MSFPGEHLRTLKIKRVLEIIKENNNKTIQEVIAALYGLMCKRTAKEYLETLHLRGDIEIYNKGNNEIRVRMKG